MGGKYFENENIFLAEGKKNIEGKGGKNSFICTRKQIYRVVFLTGPP